MAITDGHMCLPLAFYRAVSGTSLLYLTDRHAAVKYTNTDRIQLNIQWVAPLLSCNVQQLDDFTSIHNRLLVYTGPDVWDWLPKALAERGFTLQIVARSPDNRQQLLSAERIGPIASGALDPTARHVRHAASDH
jgi:hypothetical protein